MINVVCAMSPGVLQYLEKYTHLNLYLLDIMITRQETLQYLASCIHHLL